MSSSAEAIKGNIIIVAHIIAATGKADEVAELIKAVRDSANSDAEPGTFVYRIARYDNKFAHFEEYENPEAIKVHMSLPAFQKLIEAKKAGTITEIDYAYYKEF